MTEVKYWFKRILNLASFGKKFKPWSIYYCFHCRKWVSRTHTHRKKFGEHRVVAFGWKKDPRDPRDLTWRRLFRAARKIPDRVDLREHAGPIRNQLNEGACVGFAATSLKNWWEKVQGDYPEKQGGISPRCCYNGAKWIGGYLNEEGAYLRDALRFLKTYGTVTEAEWPYVPQVDAKVPPLSRVTEKQMEPWRIESFLRLESVDEVLEALASGVPVYIGTPWFTNWLNIGKSGKLPPANDEVAGGHATLLLGYDLKEGYVIGQNSWGASWGDRGFYYMLIDDLRKVEGYSDFWTVVDLEPPSPPEPEPTPSSKVCDYLAQAKKVIETLQAALKCEEKGRKR